MGQEREVLVFEVDGRRHGMPAAEVRELVRAVAIRPLPGAPPAIEGIINLRGQAVAVLDLRCRFGLPTRPVQPSDHFLITSWDRGLVALRVDRAVELVTLAGADLEEASQVVPGIAQVRWLARWHEELVPIHDLDTLLRGSDAQQVEAALEARTPADREEAS